MPSPRLPDLTFPLIANGSHRTPWDLGVYLYKGAAAIDRRKVALTIESGALGLPLYQRLSLLTKLHEAIQEKLAQGGAGAATTAISELKHLARFIEWADENAADITLEKVRESYIGWVESLVQRHEIAKDISHVVAYSYAVGAGRPIAITLGTLHPEPARVLIAYTRMRPPDMRKRVLSSKADKQRLDETFSFGHLMTDLCGGLGADVIRGPIPITVTLRDGQNIVLKGGLKKADLDPNTLQKTQDRMRALRKRAPLDKNEDAIEKRPIFINLRIECELLIFIAQTGMNLSQAAKLRRGAFRWQSDGDDVLVYRVFKGRRDGEAVFRCFRAYRSHLASYVAWLDALGLSDGDGEMFPFIRHMGTVPPANALPVFSATQVLCKELGLKRLMAQHLRKTRINWLLRYSRNPKLTSDMAAHTKETLLRKYEEPHHQAAAREIVSFHEATDPSLKPPGPGNCVGAGRGPESIPGKPISAPEPDCTSPEGCLFCIHHRDVMSADYCWKLACHSHLKKLEVALYKPPKTQPAHPANAVTDRIESKLNEIMVGSDVRGQWVNNARDDVRAGIYHPFWSGQIELLEALI